MSKVVEFLTDPLTLYGVCQYLAGFAFGSLLWHRHFVLPLARRYEAKLDECRADNRKLAERVANLRGREGDDE